MTTEPDTFASLLERYLEFVREDADGETTPIVGPERERLDASLRETRGALERHVAILRDAIVAAKAHTGELRDAWERGAITSHDGRTKDAERSNRNVAVDVQLRNALNQTRTATI